MILFFQFSEFNIKSEIWEARASSIIYENFQVAVDFLNWFVIQARYYNTIVVRDFFWLDDATFQSHCNCAIAKCSTRCIYLWIFRYFTSRHIDCFRSFQDHFKKMWKFDRFDEYFPHFYERLNSVCSVDIKQKRSR